ncbi:MAG: Ig-like domain-containing protein, partial [Candidatus Korarchaeota archaeon]
MSRRTFSPALAILNIFIISILLVGVISTAYSYAQSIQKPRYRGTVIIEGSEVLAIAFARIFEAAGYKVIVKNSEAQKPKVVIKQGGEDTTPPTVQITAPPNGSYVSGTTPLTIESSDNVAVNKTILYIEGSMVAAWSGGGTFTYDWDTTQYTDGPKNVTVWANDTSGNTNSAYYRFIVDNTSPYVHIDVPSDGECICCGVSILVTWSDTNPDRCELYIDGVLKCTWTITGTGSYSWDTTQVDDGPHTIEARAYDKAGNTASHSITVIVDNTSPTVHIDEPLNETYVSGIVTVQVTWNDTNPDKCELYIDGVLTYTWTTTGTVTYNWDTTQVDDGPHTIEVIAYDKVENTASYSVTVIVDNTPPTISIISPEPLAWFNKTPVTVKWKATDNESGISHYEIRIDEGEWIDVGTSTSYTFTNLAEGNHTVEVKAIDRAGNAQIASVQFGVDLTPPTVSITSPPSGT